MQSPPADPKVILYFGAILLAVIAHSIWRYHTARGVAEEWLAQHRYRVRKLGMGWSILPRFAPKLFRNEDRAWQFRAEVDDLRLGGTGVVWLRVWTDWMGLVDREVEVNWELMPRPVDADSETLDDRLMDAQVELLARVDRGESTFRSRSRSIDDGGAFDEVVEHVMALERRGLVTCDPPLLGHRGNMQYEAVTNVRLTTLGRRLLAERPPR